MADRTEIMDELETLATHCRAPLMDVETKGRWFRSWGDDLSDFPIAAIKSACRRWRQGAITKFPTPGQLLPFVREAAMPVPKLISNQAWAPVSEEEYEAMTLSEKAREHRLLGNHELRRAGPQGRDTPPDQMSLAWHDHRARAKNHFAEADHLQNLIWRE